MSKTEEKPLNQPLIIFIHGIHGYLDWDIPALLYKNHGYETAIFRYSPMGNTIEELSENFANFYHEKSKDHSEINIIAHSMGGLIAHDFLMREKPQNFGRAVFLATPFGGSQNADFYHHYLEGLFKLTSGESGYQLTRAYREENPIEQPDYPLAIITGDNAGPLYFWNRKIMNEERDGPDDGLVPVSSATAVDTDDVCIVSSSHNFILYNSAARKQALNFIRKGSFQKNLKGCRFPQP